jgi:tetratricopeptide (TPR) repeat protein
MRSILLISILLLSLSAKSQYKDLNKLYEKGKFEQIIEQGMPKLQTSPDDAVLNMLVGRGHIALRNYNVAIPFLKKAYNNEASHLSVKSWSLAELGVAYYHTGQTKLGVESLRKAMEMKATRNCNRFANKQLLRFQENIFFQKWNVQETEHIRFHFQDESVIENLENYKNKHEEAYLNINKFFKANLSKQIDLFVWKDREEAYDLFERKLGFANSDRKIINAWYKQTKGHEICHILCDVAIKSTKKTMLINEGICVYFDQTVRNKLDEARRVLPKGEFYLLELWESPTRYDRGLSYPIGAAFIDFLIRKEGKVKIKELLKDQTIENAKMIYPDLKELVKVFEAMVKS